MDSMLCGYCAKPFAVYPSQQAKYCSTICYHKARAADFQHRKAERDQKPKPVYIYVMIDPRTDEIRYAGKTDNPPQRFKDHLRLVREGHDHSHKAMWLKQLFALGLLPIFKIVKDTTQAEWIEDERTIIRSLRANGVRLTNLAPGGEGGDPEPMLNGYKRKFEKGCKRGHPWTVENTALVHYADGTVARTCRTCKQARSNARYRELHSVPTRGPLTPTCPQGHPRTEENTVMIKDRSRPTGTVMRCRLCSRERGKRQKRRARETTGTCHSDKHPISPEHGLWTVGNDGKRHWHCLSCKHGKSGRFQIKKLNGQLRLPF